MGCKIFSVTYGHTWEEIVDDTHKKDAATYEQAAVYYKSCSVCGAKHESDTFTYGSALVREDDDKDTGSQTPDSTPNTTPDTTPSQAPKTGDGADVAV